MSTAITQEFSVLEPAIDPNNRISFLLDWELTMKCNLDCSYCAVGTYGGHDNSTKHPPISECLSALDFMFAYVDLYMNTKPQGIRYVILNVYGGESLHHPDIINILSQIREKYQPYTDRWHLTVTTTTNAIISNKKLKQIIPFIDEFTVSYHSESTEKQKQQFKNNLLTIADSGRRQKCVVLMHQQKNLFQDATDMITWLTKNGIKILPKQLDGDGGVDGDRLYGQQQVQWFNKFYSVKTFGHPKSLLQNKEESHLTDVGRACCGGRQTCINQNYKQRHFYVENKFPDWYCSVNHFFLFVKQVNGEIYVNKDCKMNFEGQVGPIGHLENTDLILSKLKMQLDNNTLPIIQCKKYNCLCGLCAPKAKNLDTYQSIMEKYQKDYAI
jgi:pyruvate-formate lyase-activating enzyme